MQYVMMHESRLNEMTRRAATQASAVSSSCTHGRQENNAVLSVKSTTGSKRNHCYTHAAAISPLTPGFWKTWGQVSGTTGGRPTPLWPMRNAFFPDSGSLTTPFPFAGESIVRHAPLDKLISGHEVGAQSRLFRGCICLRRKRLRQFSSVQAAEAERASEAHFSDARAISPRCRFCLSNDSFPS
jgi:hypothetical protein